MTERTTPATLGVRLPRLTMPELWAALAVLLPVFGALLATISTVDLAYHLRAGAIVLDQRVLPSPDTFTFTAAGLPWLDQQWGAQVAFAAIYRMGGWALLAVVRALLVGLIAWLVFRGCRAAGAGTRAAAWLTLAGFAVGLVALGLRPQLLGMVLFSATLAILAGRERRSALVWAIPLLVVVWANVHGSFFLGPAAVAVAWLEDLANGRPGRIRLLVVAAISGLATLVNPYGAEVWGYALGLAANPTIRKLISEWQVTSPLSFAGAIFYGSIVGSLAIIAVVVRRRPADRPGGRVVRRAWPTLAWLVALTAIGAFAERGVAWWSVGAPIALAGLTGMTAPSGPDRAEASGSLRGIRGPARSLAATAIVAVLSVAILALVSTWRGGDALYGPPGLLSDAPRALTDAALAAARPGNRVWTAQRWGSWFEFTSPSTTVAVDSRIELIPADAWADHLALSAGSPDWGSILDRHGVAIVVASATEQAALIPLLRASPDWRSVRDEQDGAVFVRATP